MSQRMIAAFALCIALLAAVMFRVYHVSQGDFLAEAALRQSSYALTVAEVRGSIYDCNMQPLVNSERKLMGAILPTPESAATLLDVVGEDEREALMTMLESNKPFLYPLETDDIYANGVDIFEVPVRYSPNQTAVHVLGYVQDEGRQGVAGIEKAYDQLLKDAGNRFGLRYNVDAAGHFFAGESPQSIGNYGSAQGGVVLTLDSRIQRAAEESVIRHSMAKGAVVVMDIYTGDIKAMVSMPTFDPNNVAAKLDDPDGPFLNRTLHSYNVGSSFKLTVAAAALQQGISQWQSYTCTGEVKIGDQTFRCNKAEGHGKVDMQDAIKYSCNAYFIYLARDVGAAPIHFIASQVGFGSASQLAPELKTQTGNLTDLKLLSGGELANFSFGQGMLTATPVQIAQMVSTIANGGMSVTPRLVEGFTQDGVTISEHTPVYAQNQVMRKRTSDYLRQFMVATVESGSGTNATPEHGGAGGKTASAQTGVIVDGDEIVHAWFSGFYPAQSPRYSIVVLVEGGESGGRAAAPIFKDIADAIGALR